MFWGVRVLSCLLRGRAGQIRCRWLFRWAIGWSSIAFTSVLTDLEVWLHQRRVQLVFPHLLLRIISMDAHIATANALTLLLHNQHAIGAAIEEVTKWLSENGVGSGEWGVSLLTQLRPWKRWHECSTSQRYHATTAVIGII
jgi:hypothetical protein